MKFILKALFCFCFLLVFLSFELYSSANPPIKTPQVSEVQNFDEHFRQGEEARVGGEFKLAIHLFEKASSVARKKNDQSEEIKSLLKLGVLYWNIGDFEKSLAAYRNANTLARQLQAKEAEEFSRSAIEIQGLYSESKKSSSSGDLQKSIEYFEKAIDLARRIGSEEHGLKCLRQLSLAYWDLNNFQKFFGLNKQALSLARKLRHRQDEARSLNNIGLFYSRIENYSEALKDFERALEIARQEKSRRIEAECLNNLSLIYIDVGNYDRSLEYLNQALAIDRVLGDEASVSKDLNNIGEALRRKGLFSNNRQDFFSALDTYDKSLELAKKINDKKTEIEVLNNMGAVYSHLGNNVEALKYFSSGLEKAEALNDLEAMGMIINNIGIVYSNQGNYEESTKYYRKAIDLALEFNGGQILWEAYLEIANSYKKQKRYVEALQNYKRSISIIEDIRSQLNLEVLKASYFSTDKRIEAYHNLIDLLVKLDQASPEKIYGAEAFNYLEKAKARSFLDSLEVAQVNVAEEVGQKFLNEEAEIMNDISKLYTKLLAPQLTPEQKDSITREIESLEEKHEDLKRKIRTSSPAYANLRYPEIITLSEAQKDLLDSRTAFFAYCLARENSYAFVISKNSLKIFPLPPLQEIQKSVHNYLKALTDVDRRDFSQGYKLFCDLVQPGLDESIQKLVFIPDDILHFLPFEALTTRKEGTSWLVKDYRIAYAPSLSSLRELIHRKKVRKTHPKKDILAFGDPAFGSNETEGSGGNGENIFQDLYSQSDFKLFRLKYSGLELQKIASLFKKSRKDIFMQDDASEENLKAHDLTNYKIIHFATHAVIDDRKPARSAIILRLDQDPEEDGFLQMREIFNLKLNADLVTLSACQTGSGQLIKGEGIEGLNRAFFYAGASSVLMSLWSVSDETSCQLMERFYFHLRSSASIMDALRKAKLEMIDSGILSHPYYWAGFIATGNTSQLILPRRWHAWAILVISLCAGSAIFLIAVIHRKKA